MTTRIALISMLSALAVGCDDGPDPVDAGDAGGVSADAGLDAGGGGDDAGTDAGGTDAGSDASIPSPDEPVVIALSPGHDRVFAITHDAAGNLLATGQIADGVAAAEDFEIFVARITPTGVLDPSFGTGGITRVNVAEGGRALEVGNSIALQSTGEIVVAGTAEHDPTAGGLAATDTDIVILRFTADGDLDATFGAAGIDRIDAGTGLVTTNAMGTDVWSARDTQQGLGIDSMDRIVIHGTTRAPAPATDTDYALLRRLPDGGPDTTFGGGDGIVTLEVGGANATARTLTVLPDDRIIGAGYTTSSVLVRPDATPTSQQPVLWRVTAAGELDPTFATMDVTTTPGVWHDFASPAPELRNAEAYAAAPLSDGRLVTIGYGPTYGAGTGTDIVSFRFSADGVLDATYGAVYVDVGMDADNGRFIIVLPDDRTFSVGRGRPVPPAGGTLERDGLILVLSADGVPDETFGANGLRLYDVGGDGDHLWGASVFESSAGDWVAAGGIAGGETDADDDDSVFVLIPL